MTICEKFGRVEGLKVHDQASTCYVRFHWFGDMKRMNDSKIWFGKSTSSGEFAEFGEGFNNFNIHGKKVLRSEDLVSTDEDESFDEDDVSSSSSDD